MFNQRKEKYLTTRASLKNKLMTMLKSPPSSPIKLTDDEMAFVFGPSFQHLMGEITNELKLQEQMEKYDALCKEQAMLSKEREHALFAEAAEPLMKYLAKNNHPNTKVIVDATSAEIVEGKHSHVTFKYTQG